MAAICLMVLQRFDIPYEISVEEDFIIFDVPDDLEISLYYNFGFANKMLTEEVERIFMELQWPLKQKE